MRIGSLLLLTLFLLTACTQALQSPPESATVTSTPPGDEPASTSVVSVTDQIFSQVRNAEYQLGAATQVQVVTLRDGEYRESVGTPDDVSVSMANVYARGDLSGDGQDDVAVLVTETYGSSETFVFLAVYEIEAQTPVFLTTIFVDDQPKIDGLSITNEEIFVDATAHRTGDEICCPTLPTSRRYRLLNGILLMTSYSTQTPGGQLRSITIDSPVDGADVSGAARVTGSITVAPFENNLVYRIFDSGGVEVVAGPITVTAPDLGAPGTFSQLINITAFAGTTIRLVVQDVNAADGSLFAMESVILRVR